MVEIICESEYTYPISLQQPTEASGKIFEPLRPCRERRVITCGDLILTPISLNGVSSYLPCGVLNTTENKPQN